MTNKLNPSSSAPSKCDPYILLNPKFHYHVDNRPLIFSNLSQLHRVHKLPLHYFKIRLNMIFLRSLGILSGLILSGAPAKTLRALLFSPIRVTCSVRLTFRDWITFIIKYLARRTSYEVRRSSNVSSLLAPNAFLGFLFSNSTNFIFADIRCMCLLNK